MRVDRVLGQRGCLCRQFAAQRCDEVVELIACGLAGQVGAAHACSIRQSNSQYINRLSASILDVMVQSNGIRWGCEACRQRAERAEGRTEQRTRRRPRRCAIRDLEINAAALQIGLASQGNEVGFASDRETLHGNAHLCDTSPIKKRHQVHLVKC